MFANDVWQARLIEAVGPDAEEISLLGDAIARMLADHALGDHDAAERRKQVILRLVPSVDSMWVDAWTTEYDSRGDDGPDLIEWLRTGAEIEASRNIAC